MPTDKDIVILAAPVTKEIMQGFQPGSIQNFDSSPLQVTGITARIVAIVGKEGNAKAHIPADLHHIGQTHTAGILVGLRRGGVDHQNSSPDAVLAGLKNGCTVVRIRNLLWLFL